MQGYGQGWNNQGGYGGYGGGAGYGYGYDSYGSSKCKFHFNFVGLESLIAHLSNRSCI